MKARLFPYQRAMGRPEPSRKDGPPTGADLERYLAEVDARTQLRAYDAMERRPVAKHENTVEGYCPFDW